MSIVELSAAASAGLKVVAGARLEVGPLAGSWAYIFRRRSASAMRDASDDGRADAVAVRGTAVDRARMRSPGLGSRQGLVLAELEAAEPGGITIGEIANALNCARAEVQILIADLVEGGLAEQDSSLRPSIYRLGAILRE